MMMAPSAPAIEIRVISLRRCTGPVSDPDVFRESPRRRALAVYCQAWARWVEAEKKLAEFGTVVKAPSGFLQQSPYLSIANKAIEQMTRLLVEFGMSSSPRTRVSASWVPPVVPAQAVAQDSGEDPRELLRMLK